jgi:hypothetical protein
MKRAYIAPDIASEKVEATALAQVFCTCGCPPQDVTTFIPTAVSTFLVG